MRFVPTRPLAFTVVELLVCIAIVGILTLIAIPNLTTTRQSGSMTGMLSNARQLHLATQTMSLDTFNADGDGLEWTSRADAKGNVAAVPLPEYFDALVKANYLTDQDLRKLLSYGKKDVRRGPLNAQNIAFKIFRVQEESPSDQPLLVSANWEPKGLTDEEPFGKKGFVVFAKGGSGGIYQRTIDVTSTNVFPSGSGQEKVPYRYEALR